MNIATEPCVFIVDDDEDIRTSLSRALRTRGYNTQVFDSAHAFLAGYDPARSGCLILDYGLPQMNGLELQQVLVNRGRALPIIFITGHGGVSEAVRAMKFGAVDFLEKPFRQEALLARIDTALQIDAKARDVDNALKMTQNKLKSLTQREREIAEFLVLNPSNSSSKDVARHLDISPRTVDHHRARILDKMNVQSVAELVDLALTYQLFEKPET
ncbi:response regulator transcription factor [Roseobacter sp. OBYS 0001]|uniref:response regulator transcription factor n=1 Tax=Roseobacter sp. OBYS 0001 TaxID=882651 RepID=UPI001BC2BEF5|nr:response regulator [Roseobacter sp. OBYS 0001]GIT87273.1 DNA-binding response regulator [Roseobacter sp. OBYS 0001]